MSILKRQVLFVLFAFAATLCAFAQNKTITGLVVDGNGESIIGASVLVKGTTNGIITDIDGKFTLNDVPEAGVIQISYIGYKTQEISAKNKTNLKVVLVEDNEGLWRSEEIGCYRRHDSRRFRRTEFTSGSQCF